MLYVADPDSAAIVEADLGNRPYRLTGKQARVLVDETIWGLSIETSFGLAVAKGYADLFESAGPDRIETYRAHVRQAGKNGPTLGKLMATYLVPVLVHGDADLVNRFFDTARVMLSKGQYTLNAPFEALAAMLNSGDVKSGSAFTDLLCALYSHDMTYNQSLRLTHALPKAVSAFPLKKRHWQIRQLERIVKTDFLLADPFLDGLEKGLRLLSEASLDRYVTAGIGRYNADGESGRKFLALRSVSGTDLFSEMRVAATFSEMQPVLNRYLRARTGVSLSVRPFSSMPESLRPTHTPTVLSDGQFIYLPDEIDDFPNPEANTDLYKCLAKIESAYEEFGTFDFDFDKAMARLGKSVPETDLPDVSDHERFFGLFPDPALAADLFTAFEHGRIRILLSKHYPGIVRQCFPVLAREAEMLFKNENGPISDLYAKIALGIGLSESDFDEIANRFESKVKTDASPEIVAESVFQVYGMFSETAKHKRLKTPFGRTLRPDLYYETRAVQTRTARKIRIKLRERGLDAWASDIRKRLVENGGSISPDDLKDACLGAGAHAESQINAVLANLSEFVDAGHASRAVGDVSGPASWYGEWDCRLQDYLRDHVRVCARTVPESVDGFYNSVLNRHRGLVKQIRRAFEMLKPESLVILRQWIEGDEFDYRAMLDFAMDRKAGIMPSDRLYIKRVKQQRDVAVLLLADLSRSTSNPVQGSDLSVLDLEKEAIVLFCEALRVVGDSFAIAGFSGTGRLGVDYHLVKEFDEPLDDTVRNRINAVAPQRSTRMGAAVRHAAACLEKIPAKVRLLIILSDGFPNDTGYKREYAIEDTRKAISEARSKNLFTRAITVNISGDRRLDDLYGGFRHNVISDVRELPDKLLRIYGAVTR